MEKAKTALREKKREASYADLSRDNGGVVIRGLEIETVRKHEFQAIVIQVSRRIFKIGTAD